MNTYVHLLSIFLIIFLSVLSLTSSLHLSVRTLLSSPTLPPPPVLTSHFLFPPVNINSGLMCAPAQLSALEELTAHIVGHGHHILQYTFNPRAFSCLLSAQKNDRQALRLFTFSEEKCSVTSNLFSDLNCCIQRFE